MRNPARTDLTGTRPVVCLEVTWGGTVYRVATEDLTLESEDGSSEHVFSGDLAEIEWEELLNVFATSADSLSFPVEMDFPDTDVGARNRRHRLGAATGELSFVLVSKITGEVQQRYEQRFHLLAGRISQAQFNHPERGSGWARFSLEERPFDDTGKIIPDTARIDGGSWFDHRDDTLGKVYPVVFGSGCGYSELPTADAAFRAGSPAYLVKTVGTDRWLLISLGHVAAETVTIKDSLGNMEQFDVELTTDGYGQPVSIVNVYSSVIDENADEFWVSWGYNASPMPLFTPAASAGILKVDGAGPIAGAGDLLVWLLSRSSLGVDVQAWNAWSTVLNRYKLAGFIHDPALSPWAFIQQHLFKLLSIGLISGGRRGIRPIIHDYAAPPSRVVAEIVIGEDWIQTGPTTTRGKWQDIRNRISLEYSHDPVGNAYRRSVILDSLTDPSIGEIAALSAIHSLYTEESQAEWGVIPEVISTEYVYDPATARLIAAEAVMRLGFLSYDTPFEADFEWGWVQQGDRVRVTSADLSWPEQVATVVGRRPLEEGWAFLLLTRDDPARDRRG